MRRLLALAASALILGVSVPAPAHHVGVYIPKDDDLSKNAKEIKFAAAAGRFELGLKLFDEGIVHATMEKHERRLPRGLEDGLRAAFARQDLPSVELPLAIFLAFLTTLRLEDAVARLQASTVAPERRRDQARKLIDAAWRYYNLADFVVSAQDPKAAVAVRMGFEDGQTYLGGMMVDPMWAAAATAKPAKPDEAAASAAIARAIAALGTFITNGGAVARAGTAGRFLPRR